MARVLKLVDSEGVLSDISLLNTSGMIPLRGDAARLDLSQAQIDFTTPLSEPVLEEYKLTQYASSQDNAATQLMAFAKMMRKALAYHRTTWQRYPVYLMQQGDSETNARYAIVLGARGFGLPDIFDVPFAVDARLEGMTVSILREHPWRSAAPNTQTALISLDSPDIASSTIGIQVANHFDDVIITHVYTYDASAASFSSNLINTNHALFPSPAGQDDCLYIGSTSGFPKNIVVPVSTAGVCVASPKVEIWTGAAWTELGLGSSFTVTQAWSQNVIFSGGSDRQYFCIYGASGWTYNTVNSVSAFWVRIRLNPFTSMTTVPTCNPAIVNITKPYFEIANTVLKGDVPPLIEMQMWQGVGFASGAPNHSTVARVIMGAKSKNLTKFSSHLNCGGYGMGVDWTATMMTDATVTGGSWLSPRGFYAGVSFATDSTMKARVRFTGGYLFDDYRGQYKAFVRAYQVGGAAGDTQLKLRFSLDDYSSAAVKYDTATVKLKSINMYELVDLGIVQIPFGPSIAVDNLAITLYIQVMAERTTGSSTLALNDVILIPVDEWSVTLDDPVTDIAQGTSSLAGWRTLVVDGGVLMNRTMLYYGSVPGETWVRQGRAPRFEPLTKYRIFCLSMQYPATHGTGPMVANIGKGLELWMRPVMLYQTLRGSD